MKNAAAENLTSGQIAKQAGVNVQTLRYYERIGLLKPSSRSSSGYRVYEQDSLKRLQFIKRAQDLGFTLDEVRELLAFRVSSAASRQRVRTKAKEKLEDIRKKITSLRKLEATLRGLIQDCEKNDSSGCCPILEKMEGRL